MAARRRFKVKSVARCIRFLVATRQTVPAREPESFCARIRFLWRPSSASKIASRSNGGAIELSQSFTSRTILSLSCRHPIKQPGRGWSSAHTGTTPGAVAAAWATE